jgi:hypothetical protein
MVFAFNIFMSIFNIYLNNFTLLHFLLVPSAYASRKQLSLMAYFTIPLIRPSNILHQFRAATPHKQRKLQL